MPKHRQDDSILDSLTRAAEEKYLARLRRGPTRVRVSGRAIQLGDQAPDLDLEDSDGNRVQLSDFWRDRPAVLMFWRHFGCGCGMERAELLKAERSQLKDAGADVVIIGQGEPPRARAYAEQFGLTEPILCDSDFRAYEAYGLPEGTSAQVVFDAPDEYLRGDPDAWRSLIQKRREAGRPLVDNPWQLPGEFVIDQRGTVRLAYRYQYCEDYPDPRVLVAAVKEAKWELPIAAGVDL
ncbi:MAG: redoxin domain-containing protein [Acidimicrobiia bacterium]